MSNINRLNNSIDDDDNDDDMQQLLDESDTESTTTDQTYSSGCMSIPPQQLTSLSQLVGDERSDHSNQMTNQRMDELTAYQPHLRRSSTPVNEFVIPISEAWPWTEESPFDYVFAAHRDEQSNDRIAYPSDALENILINFRVPMMIRFIFDLMWNNIPLGVQDTQPHTMVVFVVNNTFHRDVIINNENGDINEDGTILNDTDDDMDDENMNSNDNRERENQMIWSESTGAEATDAVINNINSIVSTDAQDDHSNITRENEQTMEHDGTSEIEHQDHSNDNRNKRGQASPRPENADNNRIQDNVQTNTPAAPIHIPSTPTTSTIGSSTQAQEIEPLQAGPADNNNHMAEDPDVLHSNTGTPKQPSPAGSSNKETVQ